jgi:uncharacterized membrane protein
MAQTIKKPAAPVVQPRTVGGIGRLDWAMLGLLVLGIGISGYLTWTHFADVPIICSADGGCDKVNKSSYAYFPPEWGVPVAIIGLVGYIGLLGMWAGRTLLPAWRGKIDVAVFVATLVGVIFSGYLTAMELFVIHAICWWCVGSALVITVLFALSVVKVWNAAEY